MDLHIENQGQYYFQLLAKLPFSFSRKLVIVMNGAMLILINLDNT